MPFCLILSTELSNSAKSLSLHASSKDELLQLIPSLGVRKDDYLGGKTLSPLRKLLCSPDWFTSFVPLFPCISLSVAYKLQDRCAVMRYPLFFLSAATDFCLLPLFVKERMSLYILRTLYVLYAYFDWYTFSFVPRRLYYDLTGRLPDNAEKNHLEIVHRLLSSRYPISIYFVELDVTEHSIYHAYSHTFLDTEHKPKTLSEEETKGDSLTALVEKHMRKAGTVGEKFVSIDLRPMV